MSSPHATGSTERSGPTKQPDFKGQSRVLKKCHWCMKKQDPNEEPFKACGQCKEVCGVTRSSEMRTKTNEWDRSYIARENANGPAGRTIRHSLHIENFKHAIVCALDLGKDPKNVDSGYLFIEVKRKPNHADLPMKRKFELIEGVIFTPDETLEMLGAQGKTVLDTTKRQGEYMKAKGGIGMAPIIMKYGGVVDIVNFILPKPEGAKLMQKQNNWGKEWRDFSGSFKGTAGMVYEKAIFQTKDGRHPRNALPGSWWWTALFFTALTWAFAGASIGVAAASIVRFKNLKNSVADIFSPAEVELSAHNLYPAGIIILVLCSVVFFFTTWLALHFFTHLPGTTKPAHRGFHGVPSFYWTISLLLLVLVIFTFVDILVYTHYFRTGNLIIKAWLPDGVVVEDLELDQIYNGVIAQLPHGLAYVNYTFFLLVAILPWIMVFSGLITVFTLWFGADETIEDPALLDGPNASIATPFPPPEGPELKPRDPTAPHVVEETRETALTPDPTDTAAPVVAGNGSQANVSTTGHAGTDTDLEAGVQSDSNQVLIPKVAEHIDGERPADTTPTVPVETEDTIVLEPTKESHVVSPA